MATDQTDTTWKFTFQDLDQWARENFPTEYAALPDVSTIRFSNHSNSINSRGILSTRIYVGHRSANDKTGIHGYWDTVNSRSLFRTGREQRYRKHLYAYTVKELCKPFSDIPGVIVNSRYNAPLKSYEPIGCLVTYYFLAKGLVTSISTGSLDLQMFQWACRTVANGEPAPEIVRQEGVIKQLEHIVRTRAASEAQLVPQSPVKSQQTAVNVPANSSTIAQPVRTDPHEGTTQNSGQTAQSDTDSATQNSQPTLSVTGSTTETGAQNRRHATPSVAESATNTQASEQSKLAHMSLMQGLFSKKQNSRSSELEKVAAEKRALEEEHAAFRQEMQQKMQLSSKKLQQLLQAHKALLENYLQDEPEETRRQVLEALNGEFGILDNPEV